MEAADKRHNESLGEFEPGGLEVIVLEVGTGEENWAFAIKAHSAGTKIPRSGDPNVGSEATHQRHPAELLPASRYGLE